MRLHRYLPAGQSSMCNSTPPVDRRAKPCTRTKFRAKNGDSEFGDKDREKEFLVLSCGAAYYFALRASKYKSRGIRIFNFLISIFYWVEILRLCCATPFDSVR